MGVLLFAVVAVTAYWGIWFFGDRAWLASADTESYFVFENAFPAADGWMALAAALAAHALWRRREQAFLWLVAAGSASVYLAAMDVLFDLQNGIYRAPLGDWGAVVTEILINVFSLGCGLWAIAFAWRHRRVFQAWGATEQP